MFPSLAVCLHGGYHQQCSCFQPLSTLCERGWADHTLVSPNKLLPAVPCRIIDKKKQRTSSEWLGLGFFLLVCFSQTFRKLSVLGRLKQDTLFVLILPSRKTIFLVCKSGRGRRFLTAGATYAKCLFPYLENGYNWTLHRDTIRKLSDSMPVSKSLLCDLPGGSWFIVFIKGMRFLQMRAKKRRIKSWAGQDRKTWLKSAMPLLRSVTVVELIQSQHLLICSPARRC